MFEHIKKGDVVRLECGKVGYCKYFNKSQKERTVWLTIDNLMYEFSLETGWEMYRGAMHSLRRIDQEQYNEEKEVYVISAFDAYNKTYKFEVTPAVLKEFFCLFKQKQDMNMVYGNNSVQFIAQRDEDKNLVFAAEPSIPQISRYKELLPRVTEILMEAGYELNTSDYSITVSWEPKE